MENKVYYGEYSLKHWIELIIRQNIKLPDYQRSFVWNEEKVENLLASLQEKQFVPPVTIGAFNIDSSTHNYILDGQQRLTSLLLAYLGLYPNKDEFKNTETIFANENDDEIEEDENPTNNILGWTFNKILELGNSRDSIRSNAEAKYYMNLDLGTNDDFFENNFLGFSYLVPSNNDETAQQKYYSTVFRDINIQGERLLPQESRKSLYFLNDKFPSFFEPKICNRYNVNNTKLDFVRYLSLLSQYIKNDGASIIARGYKPKMEKYYERFIYSVVNNSNDSMFSDMSVIAAKEVFDERLSKLENAAVSIIGNSKLFTSIIGLDIYFFGLIYFVVFLDKSVDLEECEELLQDIEKVIEDFKNTPSHTRSPAALKYLKERIVKSIEIYNKYINE